MSASGSPREWEYTAVRTGNNPAKVQTEPPPWTDKTECQSGLTARLPRLYKPDTVIRKVRPSVWRGACGWRVEGVRRLVTRPEADPS